LYNRTPPYVLRIRPVVTPIDSLKFWLGRLRKEVGMQLVIWLGLTALLAWGMLGLVFVPV
jgi:hypothetical protein